MDVTVVAVYVSISIYPDYFLTKLPVSHNIARYKYQIKLQQLIPVNDFKHILKHHLHRDTRSSITYSLLFVSPNVYYFSVAFLLTDISGTFVIIFPAFQFLIVPIARKLINHWNNSPERRMKIKSSPLKADRNQN